MKSFIIDLDGTLYSFDGIPGRIFSESQFHDRLKKNIYELIEEEYSLDRESAMQKYDEISEACQKEFSIYFEKEKSISREKFFSKTWNMLPEDYIEKNEKIEELFKQLRGRILILTSGPAVWARKVISYLGISEYVKDHLVTGEGDDRKPHPESFKKAMNMLDSKPENTIAIGDQESTDLAPARTLGMKTIKVGTPEKNADYTIASINELLPLLKKEGLL